MNGKALVRTTLATLLCALLGPVGAVAQTCCDGTSSSSAPSCQATCGAPASDAPTEAAACASTCGSPTGSASCGAPDFIPTDPVTSPSAHAGPRPEDRGLVDLEPLLEPIRAVFHVPGLGAALVRDGRLAAIGTAGVRRVGSPQRLELDDAFHLGSCGKAITATVAAIMVERGMTQWTATIGESFPELAPTMHSEYRDVTLLDLFAHRGGLGPRTEVFDRSIAGFAGAMSEQRLDLVRYAVADIPAFEPGTRFAYSDVGYSIGGAMLGRAAARSWEALVEELLAVPLGLETLGFGAPGRDDPESAARGHVLREGGLVALGVGPGEDLANPAIGPAGTTHMSLGDWATFAAFHLKGARGEDTELLSTAGFDVLHRDTFAQGYGLGWFLTDNRWGEGRALTHTGSCGAWAALIWILPEQNAAMLVTTNFGGGSGYQALQLAVDRIGEQYLRR